MSLANFAIKLTDADCDQVKACIARLEEAAHQLDGAVSALRQVKAFSAEADKLLASSRSLVHERLMVSRRYDEIVGRSTARGGFR